MAGPSIGPMDDGYMQPVTLELIRFFDGTILKAACDGAL